MPSFNAPRRTGWPFPIAALAFGVVTIAAGMGATGPLDTAFTALTQTHTTRWLDWCGSLMALLGDIEVTGACVLLMGALRWGEREPGRVLRLLGLFAAATIFELGLKRWLPHVPVTPGIQRPAIFGFPVDLLDSANSYPSGHMLRWVFLMTMVVDLAPRRAVLLGAALLTGLMGFMRVYVGAHWLSDVVGGALLGWTLASCAGDESQGSGAASMRRAQRPAE